MRKAETRTREALIGAIGHALEALTAQDARGFHRPLRILFDGSIAITDASAIVCCAEVYGLESLEIGLRDPCKYA
jgi:hypothetical protein